tara:strand:+ start:1149 stop:1511 length:363 start_codon:yes stop_codon:yes gene_type:complete
MDLYVNITDENGDALGHVNIYRDGSDSEGAANIVNMINNAYAPYANNNADDVANEHEYWLVAYTWKNPAGNTVHSNNVITICPFDWIVHVVAAWPHENYVMLNAMELTREQAEKIIDSRG